MVGSITKIVSGGQTGADRAALRVAIDLGMPHGGWCPLRRRAEDGAIPPMFELDETPSEEYVQRTEWNVRNSDATVIFTLASSDAAGDGDELKGGTLLTARLARKKWNQPCLHLPLAKNVDGGASSDAYDTELSTFRSFITEHEVGVLNVAGPRELEEPGIGAAMERFLRVAIES